MPELNLDLEYFNHPKVIRLVGLLGNDADVIPIRLWVYCGKFHYEDGVLPGYSEAEIERIVGWRGTAGRCVAALVKVRFLEVIEDGYAVHDWLDHARHISRFKKHGKMMRKAKLDALLGVSAEPILGESSPPEPNNKGTTKDTIKNTTKDATSELQRAPMQGNALQSIANHAIHGSTELEPPAGNKAGQKKPEYVYTYELKDAEFEIWMNKLASKIKQENDMRENKFQWTGSGKKISEDWWVLNNRVGTFEHRKKYMIECANILNNDMRWCNCVELSIMVAVRRSNKTVIKSAMAFCIALLNNPGGLCSDVADGVLEGYRL